MVNHTAMDTLLRMMGRRRLTPPHQIRTQSPPQTSKFPPELFHMIVGHVKEPSVLAALSTVSRAFQAEAESVLYQNLSLHPQRGAALCATVSSCSRILTYTEICVLHAEVFEDGSRSPATSTRLKEAHIFRLLQAIKKMAHLRDLTIHGYPLNWNILLQGVRFKLSSFRAYCTPDSGLAIFLDKQKTIKHLTIYSGNPNDETLVLRSSSLPKLDSLVSLTVDVPCAIVPGRPVEKVEICCWLTAPVKEVAFRLGQSGTPLRVLLVSSGFKVSTSDLHVIAASLPYLEYIGELWLTDQVCNLHYSQRSFLTISWQLKYPQDAIRPLSQLRRLRTLVLSHQAFTQPGRTSSPTASSGELSTCQTNTHQIILEGLHLRAPCIQRIIFTVVLYPFQVLERGRKSWIETLQVGGMDPDICHSLWREAGRK
jgi:hypothetical protein